MSSVTLTVTLTLTEEMLGTAPGNPEVYEAFVASKRPESAAPDDERATLPLDKEIELGTTVFHRTAEGAPMLYDYQIKGFFKDACAMLARIEGTESKGIKAYKKVVDGLVFVGPRCIPIVMPVGAAK